MSISLYAQTQVPLNKQLDNAINNDPSSLPNNLEAPLKVIYQKDQKIDLEPYKAGAAPLSSKSDWNVLKPFIKDLIENDPNFEKLKLPPDEVARMTSSVLKNTQDTGVPVSVRGIFSLTKELEKAQNAMAEIASIQGTQGLPAVDPTFKFGPQQPVPPELLDEQGLLNDFSETAEKVEPYSQFWKAWNMALDEPAGQPEPSASDDTLNEVQLPKHEATDVPLNLRDVAPELAELFMDTPYEPASESVPQSEGFVTFDTFDSMEELRGKTSEETKKTAGAKTLWDIAPELAAQFELDSPEGDLETSREKESFIQFDTFDSMEELRAKASGESEPNTSLDNERYIEFNTYDSMEER